MFDIEIRRGFSAAHRLRGYDGDCKNLHGHNYGVVATVRAGELNEIGIALDFKRFKAVLDGILQEYDHRNLSDLPEFSVVNPTSEVLARTIYGRLKASFADAGFTVRSVRVEESANSAVTYFEE